MTNVKLNSQFEQVETAFALARVRMGDSSAGYNQGRGSMTAPKKAMYKKRPKTAPLAGGGTSTTGNEAGEDDYHRDHLASHTADEELATADLLDEEPGEGGEDGVVDHVDTTDEHGHELSLAEGLLKKDGEVVYHGVTSGQLLRDLRRRTDEHAVQVLGSTASEQVGVARAFGDTGTGRRVSREETKVSDEI
jgi:hypothetical protein